MKNKVLTVTVFLLISAAVIRLSWPNILRTYIETGFGSCEKIPVFCKSPQNEIINPQINVNYLADLVPYEFPKVKVLAPKGFNVIQEQIKKIYNKRNKYAHAGPVIYLLYEPPDFFVDLFPQVRKVGVNDNYEFLRRTMNAKVKEIKNLSDAFFVIMKGIFIPDLGDQEGAVMRQFALADRRGFINYYLGKDGNYFDCDIINDQDVFFKLYIKDKAARLDLEKVFTIISTLKERL